MRIGLVFGGRSGEHEVSIQSAKSIYKVLGTQANRQRYEVIPFYIQRNGFWLGPSVARTLLESADQIIEQEGSLWQFPVEVESVELWLPALHGPNGEDGTIQGLFSLMHLPYVGSGVLGSALGMDKIAMKAAFNQVGLPQVKYTSSTRGEIIKESHQLAQSIAEEIGFPCFVKPANLGSSVGVSKAENLAQLSKALEVASLFDRRVIIESAISNPRELECAILGNETALASVVGEITYSGDSGFYDYETKYTDGRSQIHIPADIPVHIVQKIQDMSIQAFRSVDAAGLSRVDFFYLESTDELFINEINTLPGFTSFSMYPQLWGTSGVDFSELIHQLIQLALERYQQELK